MVNPSAPIVTPADQLLGNASPETCTPHESTCRIPYDIVETIIAHLARDPDALKACSLTCHSWHITAVPYLHYTLTLKGNKPDIIHGKPKSLPKLHEQGLLHLIKEVRVWDMGGWFVPQAFRIGDLLYFSALSNIHTLELQNVEIYRFIPGSEHCFGKLSPTLRSVTLANPRGSHRQLSHFLSLFPNLDDIEIWRHNACNPEDTVFDTQLVSVSSLKFRGRLALLNFHWVETWMHFIASCGLRFRHMDLRGSASCASALLGACAGTIETLRFNATECKSFCLENSTDLS